MNRSPLAKKITILVVALSTVITILTTGMQLYFDYTKELKDIQTKINTIQTIQLPSLGHLMWTYDTDGIQIIIDNILKIRDIEFIEVVVDERYRWHGGELTSRNIEERKIPVYFFNGNDDVEIGKLRIVASIDTIYGRLMDKTVVILLSNGFKTFFVSLFILFLFNRLVTRHLTDLSIYAEKVASGVLKSSFTLKRNKSLSSAPDELDRAVSAINSMRENLVEDIEKLRNTEKELSQTRISVDAVSDSVFWLMPNGKIVDINNTACVSLGYSREELLTLCVEDVDPDYDREVWEHHFQELRDAKTLRFESSHRKKDGSLYPVEIIANYIVHDRVELNCAIARNIQERKQAEAEKQQLSEQLQQAQKMEAIGTLAGGIAHDFNNILSVILGYTELLKEDVQPEKQVEDKIDNILNATFRAKNLVKQILAFSRQENPEHSAIQPDEIVKEALKMLRRSLPSTIEIIENIDSDIRPIVFDPTQLHQVVMNLCTNAFHALEETGGRLEVLLKEKWLSQKDLDAEPEVSPGIFVELSVADNGPGISPENLTRIFDPYFTTKKTGKGTGMGLSIIHGIVKSSGGFITVESTQSAGTVFSVYLPVIEDEKLIRMDEAVTNIPSGNERILFVDDEELLVNMGGDLLKRLGYQVTVSNDSLEALALFRKSPDTFDLVITDQTMPNMTGTQLASKIIEIRPDVPIILCTGYSSLVSESEAKSMGIREFTLKPLTKSEVAVLVRKVLDRGNNGISGDTVTSSQ